MDTKDLAKLKKLQKEAGKLGLTLPNPIEFTAKHYDVDEDEVEDRINKTRFVEVATENKTVYMVVNKTGEKFRHYGSHYAFDDYAHEDIQKYLKGEDISRIYRNNGLNTCQQMINDISRAVFSDFMDEEAIDERLVVLPNVYHADKLKKKNDIVIEGFIPKGVPFYRVSQSWTGYSAEIVPAAFVIQRVVEDTNPEGFETPVYEDNEPEPLRLPNDVDPMDSLERKERTDFDWSVYEVPAIMKFIKENDKENMFNLRGRYDKQKRTDVYLIWTNEPGFNSSWLVELNIQSNDVDNVSTLMAFKKNLDNRIKAIKKDEGNKKDAYINKLLNIVNDFEKTL